MASNGTMASKVLVVEDDLFTRTVLQRRLASSGYEVRMSQDGEEALAMVSEDCPDLIISDWMMPKMDGQELCRRVKADCDSVYFILLTSRDQESDIVDALNSGADEYLVKPCEAKELLARVQAGLRIIALQRDLSRANQNLNQALHTIDKELQVVAGIQRSLLPQSLPESEIAKFAVHYRPSSQCGGDYYDAFPLDDGRMGLVVADVSGHGTPAMVAMALARLLTHTHAAELGRPAEFLALLNRQLYEYLPTDQYLTMFCGALDPNKLVLDYSSAGQPPPLWRRRADNEIETLKNCEGYPLKLVDPEATYRTTRIQLTPGDQLLFYTDGVTDVVNNDEEFFGMDRLTEFFTREDGGIEQMIVRLVNELESFAQGCPHPDDITVVGMSLREDDADSLPDGLDE